MIMSGNVLYQIITDNLKLLRICKGGFDLQLSLYGIIVELSKLAQLSDLAQLY